MISRNRGMSPNFVQEQLSLSYARSVIYNAGFNLSRCEVDDHGIDGTIQSYSRGRNRIDFQLKSTTDYGIRNGNVIYDLRVENYNQLIEADGVPQILILYLMPENNDLWLSQNSHEMCLRECAYWVSLMGNQPSSNSSTVRVEVPLADIFDRNGLRFMFLQWFN